jgi:hypothetical protein
LIKLKKNTKYPTKGEAMKITHRIFIGLIFSFISWNTIYSCSPERYEQSRIYTILRKAAWVDEGWGDPVSVPGVSRWNSDCKPSLTADGKYLYFIGAAQNGPPYDPIHSGGRDFNIYVARWNGTAWDSVTNLGRNCQWLFQNVPKSVVKNVPPQVVF